MRTIILANGSMRRWHDAGGIGSKHLIMIDGEPLLGRIVRQLREAGQLDIVISGPYPQFGVRNITPSYQANRADGRIAVAPWWSPFERTLVLLGDTFYSDAAMTTILSYTGDDCHLFARFGSSAITGKGWGEPFANIIPPDHHPVHLMALRRGGGLWEAYRFEHEDHGPNGRDLGNTTVIDDETEDFDFAVDLERWRERNRLTVP